MDKHIYPTDKHHPPHMWRRGEIQAHYNKNSKAVLQKRKKDSAPLIQPVLCDISVDPNKYTILLQHLEIC